MTYASHAWEFAAGSHLLKLQRLQNKDLGTNGSLPRRALTRNLHVVFKIPKMDNFITKLHRQQAEVI
jgi:hypothetical protein